jgi:hypothetical protein
MEIIGLLLCVTTMFFFVGTLKYAIEAWKRGVTAQCLGTVISAALLSLWSVAFPGFNRLQIIWLLPLTYIIGMPMTFLLPLGKWAVLIGTVALYSLFIVLASPKSGTSVVSAVAVDGLIFTALGAWYYIIVLGYGKFFQFLKARRDSKAS